LELEFLNLKKLFKYWIISVLICLFFSLQSAAEDYFIENITDLPAILMKLKSDTLKNGIARMDITSLFYSYPEYCTGISVRGKNIFLLMSNGKRILYDDHKVKSYLEEIENADLQDMLDQPYILGKVTTDPLQDFNPGGGRQIYFFKAVYGRDRLKASENLVPVNFLGKQLLFNKRNGAAEALKRVNRELSVLLKHNPQLKKYIFPVGGTFNWRNIAGSNRLSPHAFGIAIDLNSRRGAYWRWDANGRTIFSMRQKYPLEIISVFEKNNFIWGGKWFFYDLMHFEYRPEIFMKNRIIHLLVVSVLFSMNCCLSG